MSDPDWIGGYNDVPPNLAFVTLEEFFRLLSDATLPMETRFFTKSDAPELQRQNAVLFVRDVDKTGFGFIKRIAAGRYAIPDLYFTFAECVHDYRFAGQASAFEHMKRCAKCGDTYSVDSSG